MICFIGRVTEQKIQENIENMKATAMKKKVAQMKYYGTGGQSPLVRNRLLPEAYKAPVHQRLGLKQQNRVPVLGTNTSFIGPKKRDFRKTTTNFIQMGN